MPKPTAAEIDAFMHALDWTGQVELPDTTLQWLSHKLAQLWGREASESGFCDSCNRFREIVVETKLGLMCEKCLHDALREANLRRSI